jgi:hypothetical protein
MTMLTISDIREYMPDVEDYGIQSYDDFFEKTRQDIFRRLRIDWFASRRHNQYRMINTGPMVDMDTDKLDETQFTRTAVFHCLAYYILPQLTKWNPEGDQFNAMMAYYKERYNEEWALVLEDGVKYDDNDDSTFTSSEIVPLNTLKLVR